MSECTTSASSVATCYLRNFEQGEGTVTRDSIQTVE